MNQKKCNFRLNFRGKFVVACDMDFSRYPFDKHQCLFSLGMVGIPFDISRMEMSDLHYYEEKQRALQYSVNIYWVKLI